MLIVVALCLLDLDLDCTALNREQLRGEMASLSINPTGFKQIFWFEFIHKELHDIIRGRAAPSPILFWKTSEKKPMAGSVSALGSTSYSTSGCLWR